MKSFILSYMSYCACKKLRCPSPAPRHSAKKAELRVVVYLRQA